MRRVEALRVLFGLLLFGVMVPAVSFGQEPSITDYIISTRDESKTDDFVVFHQKDFYSFNYTAGGLKAILDAERLIVPKAEERITYYDFTNSFSIITSVKGHLSNGGSALFRTGVYHSINQYESGGIFHSDFYVNSMSMYEPAKSFYSLEFQKTYGDYKFLATVPFFGNYPTVNSTVTIEIPKNMDIDIVEMNFDNYTITKEEETLKKSKKISFKLRDNERLESCSYCPSINHYRPHLILVYKSITFKKDTIELMPDVASLYGWYHKVVSQVRDKPEDISELVKKFKDLPKGKEQLAAVFDWIKFNIRYIAFEAGMAGFRPDDCQSVYQKRYGDCKGMANLAKHVLIELGYDARLAWIGTRGDVPYDHSVPSLAVDNHMIAAVLFEGEFIYIDPTEKYGQLDEYAYRIQGRPVMIENGEEFILENVPSSAQESDKVKRHYTYSFDPVEKLASIRGNISMKGEARKYILYNFDHTLAQDRNDALKTFLRPYPTGSFNLVSQEGFFKDSDSLYFEYELSTPTGFIDLNSEFYLDIDPSRDMELTELEDNRVADYFFRERYNRETSIVVEIPEGYNVSYHPKNFTCHNEEFEVSVQFSEKDNVLSLEKRIIVDDGTVSGVNIAEFEIALKQLLNYYEDRVIITRH